MKAIVVTEFGPLASPPRLVDLPRPEPGPRQIRIRMQLSPIHRHDLMAITGRYGLAASLPMVPGSEGCGVVDKLGDKVDRFAPGQRVAAMASGVWAEFFIADAAAAVPIPDDLDDSLAAQLIAMPLSARRLIRRLNPRPADWLIYNAATGTVGRLIENLADEHGFNTIGIARTGMGRRAIRGGRSAVFASMADAAWKRQAEDALAGRQAAFAIDCVGGAAANDLAELLAEAGQLTCFGVLSGRPVEIDARHLLFRGVTVSGFWAHRELRTILPADLRLEMKIIIDQARRGVLPLATAAVKDFSSVVEALHLATITGRFGKILIQP